MDILSFHGKSEDICRWVIDNYDKPEYMENNRTTQLWVEASRQRLAELEQANFNTMMHVVLGSN